MVSLVGRFVSVIVGIFLVYIAVFLTVDEESRVQNRLESLWGRVRALQKQAISIELAFLQEILKLASTALDRVFGSKSISLPLLSMLLWYSYGSMHLGWWILGYPDEAGRFVAMAFAIGSLPPLFTDKTLRFPIAAMLAFPFVLWLVVSVSESVQHNWDYTPETVGVWGGALVSITLLSVIRWSLRKSSELQKTWQILTVVSLNLILAVIVLSPLLLFRCHPQYLHSAFGDSFSGHLASAPSLTLSLLTLSGVQIAFAIMIIAIIPAILPLLIILALAHRALWPLIWRPAYAAHRHELIRQHKLLGTAGLLLLLQAVPGNPILNFLSSLFHIK